MESRVAKKITDEPQWKKSSYPTSADQPNSHMVLVNWLVNDHEFTDTEELIVALLNHLLMGTSQYTLYTTLMESGIESDIIGVGLSDELLHATYSIELKGIEPSNVEAMHDLVVNTLEKMLKDHDLVVNTLEKMLNDGFSDDDIAATMNTIEFRLREFNTGSFPKRLSFMLGAMYKLDGNTIANFTQKYTSLRHKLDNEFNLEKFKDYHLFSSKEIDLCQRMQLLTEHYLQAKKELLKVSITQRLFL